jgi:hypothetical protein
MILFFGIEFTFTILLTNVKLDVEIDVVVTAPPLGLSSSRAPVPERVRESIAVKFAPWEMDVTTGPLSCTLLASKVAAVTEPVTETLDDAKMEPVEWTEPPTSKVHCGFD